MSSGKEEIKKNLYSIAGGLISTTILFFIFHFGNVLGLTDNSKESSSKIIVLFLYFTLLIGTLFVIFYTAKSNEEPQKRIKIFKNWIKVFAVFIFLLASFGLYKFFRNLSNERIPPYLVKIINNSDTVQSVSENVSISITKPISLFDNIQVDFQKSSLSQNGVVKKIIIGKHDTALASVNFISSKRLYDIYKTGEYEMTIILTAEDEKFVTISNIPFTKTAFARNFSECKLNR